MDLSADLDALFQLPLSEFTGARNALASRLQKAGRKEDADRVRRLSKPPVSAWVVNQLFWKERTWFDRLLASGARLRQAQAAGLAGKPVNVHDSLKAQREALNELSRQATAFLSRGGHAPSPDVLRRVTLDLAGAGRAGWRRRRPGPGAPDGRRGSAGLRSAGRADSEIGRGTVAKRRRIQQGARRSRRPPARPEGGRPRTAPTGLAVNGSARRPWRPGARVQEAERALASARRDATKAEAAMKTAAARLKELERDKQRAEAALEKAASAADAARQAARRTASDAAEAAQAVDDAERDARTGQSQALAGPPARVSQRAGVL